MNFAVEFRSADVVHQFDDVVVTYWMMMMSFAIAVQYYPNVPVPHCGFTQPALTNAKMCDRPSLVAAAVFV